MRGHEEADFVAIRAAYKARIDALADEAILAPEPLDGG